MPYRTLLLDADGTLLDFDRAEAEAIRQILRHYQLPETEEWVTDYHQINDALWKQLERGEIAKNDLRWVRFAKLLEKHHVDRDAVAMADSYVEELSQRGYLLPGALDACRELAQSCRLYIITNGIAAVQRRRLAAVPLAEFIEKTYISEEIGYEKPDIRYFRAVFRDIPDFDPATTLVVGDSLTSDMAGGIAAGLDTCWINPKNRPIPPTHPITFTIPSMTALPALIMRNEAIRL